MFRIGKSAIAVAALVFAPAQVLAAITLVVAGGGGGGTGTLSSAAAGNGQGGQAGSSGTGTGAGAGGSAGSGGAAGAIASGGGGGGGVNGAGGSGGGAGGLSDPTYLGGRGGSVPGLYGGAGGYGGGGGGGSQGGGGGGGYSGGGGGNGGGGGGGSYLNGSLAPLSVLGRNSNANGYITISQLRQIDFLGTPTYIVTATQTFNYAGAVTQSYTVAQDGLYSITAAGAAGGQANYGFGGAGALISGDGFFTSGTMFNLVVGGVGANGGGFDLFGNSGGGGGGGGSFVFQADAVSTPVASAVPEPTMWSAMVLGLGLVGIALRRRRSSPIRSASTAYRPC